MMNQITDRIVMVRPVNFGFNPETAENNSFQSKIDGLSAQKTQEQALSEFDAFVELLRSKGIDVMVVEDTADPYTPDSIFPNNWFTTHEDGVIITYPMYADVRRKERRDDVLEELAAGLKDSKRYGFEYFEDEDKFLEGTGSMILDRANRIVYACLSERTHVEILEKFCVLRNYKKVFFHSVDKEDEPVYHTNVMLTLGEHFAVICMDSVKDEKERELILNAFKETEKELIEISFDQMYAFAGNMIQLRNAKGERFVVMSQTAKNSLSTSQVEAIEKHGEILSPNIHTIETLGGGSARCMIAENFLPKA